ncbi:MAG: polyprenyl synthetase family protein [Cyclobacteriaceae bacterium]|nr:polyprenyl synthetase family protein [Cyclobacteriaceae bacterium]
MVKSPEYLKDIVEKKIAEGPFEGQPDELYEPIRYLMNLGGKRLRPVLALLSYQMYKDDPLQVVSQALAVEVFHNFTLMHDDIMDKAPLRRGMQTVHEKWDANRAILSGDVMLVKAYEHLASGGHLSVEILQKFNQCAIEVCEGQQLDMNFEKRMDVSEADYIEMIRLKTAVLLGFSLELGALLAGEEKAVDNLREFGIKVGLGFQLKDDLLDIYGDAAKVGKQVGGDIISGKKTYLTIKAMELSDERNRKILLAAFDPEGVLEDAKKIESVRGVYDELGVKEITEHKMNEYFDQGFAALTRVSAPLHRKAVLREFAADLIGREY